MRAPGAFRILSFRPSPPLCHPGLMRKVFIVVLNRNELTDRVLAAFSSKDFTRY